MTARFGSDGDATTTLFLGRFDEGLDGWRTNGGNKLERVSRDDRPNAVVDGSHALAVTVSGDTYPSIRNQKQVRDADFKDHPFLLASVLPGQIEGTASPVTFQFRYHARGPFDVAESPTVTVDQQYGATLAWDMHDLDADQLAKPGRLELTWYLEDNPPENGPQGRGCEFDYRGKIYVDSIRLTADRGPVDRAHWVRKRRELNRCFGARTETTVDTRTDSLLTGTFVYEDGTAVPYRATIVEETFIRLQVDGATFRFEGVNE